MSIRPEAQQTLDYYDKVLIPQLAQTVSGAEEKRQSGDHQLVQRIFDAWTYTLPPEQKKGHLRSYDQDLLHQIRLYSRRLELDLLEQEDLLKVGLAGLGRIHHVDANSQFKETGYLPTLLDRINQAQALYQRLKPETLAPWTIHGGSIYWPAEIAQDLANTYILTGDRQAAENILNEAIREIATKNLQVGGIDFKTPEETLKETGYAAYFGKKDFLGAFSAQGVLYLRKAILTRDLSDMAKALDFVSLAHRFEPNAHRLATISLRLFQASLSSSYHDGVGTRLIRIVDGTLGLIQAFLSSPKDTVSSVKQSVRERKKS